MSRAVGVVKQVVAEIVGDGRLAEEGKHDMDPKAKVRSGRDDGRPSEDDLAKRKLGEQGIPGRPPKPQTIDDDELQNPKPIDPGHTA